MVMFGLKFKSLNFVSWMTFKFIFSYKASGNVYVIGQMGGLIISI